VEVDERAELREDDVLPRREGLLHLVQARCAQCRSTGAGEGSQVHGGEYMLTGAGARERGALRAQAGAQGRAGAHSSRRRRRWRGWTGRRGARSSRQSDSSSAVTMPYRARRQSTQAARSSPPCHGCRRAACVLCLRTRRRALSACRGSHAAPQAQLHGRVHGAGRAAACARRRMCGCPPPPAFPPVEGHAAVCSARVPSRFLTLRFHV
jgi:hypothetical protein